MDPSSWGCDDQENIKVAAAGAFVRQAPARRGGACRRRRPWGRRSCNPLRSSPAIGDLAPYALNFVAMTLAAVIGGWRAGLVALITGQSLAWYAIVGPTNTLPPPAKLATLVVATLTELMVLAIIGLYQREVDRGTAEREQRLALLDNALREIDHRTRNNYQTVLATDRPAVAAFEG